MRLSSINLSGILIFLLLVNLSGFGQKRTPQNIRRVTVTSAYKIENGTRKPESWTTSQEIYDSLGRMHTELVFDEQDHYPHNYKWHTFTGPLKTKTEFFRDEKLNKVEEFTYNLGGLVIRTTVKNVTPGDTSIYLNISYTYNNQNKPIKIVAKNPKGKLAYQVTSAYDTKGTEISRKVKTKSGYSPEDSIININTTPVYDSLGRIISQVSTVKYLSKKVVYKKQAFKYDKKGNLFVIQELDNNGKQIFKEERIYREKDNRLWQISIYDSNDKLIKFSAKRYELYRTNNRRVVEYE